MTNLFKTYKKSITISSIIVLIAYAVIFIWKYNLIGNNNIGNLYIIDTILMVLVFAITFLAIIFNLFMAFINTIGINRESLIKFYGKQKFFKCQQLLFLISSGINSLIIMLFVILQTVSMALQQAYYATDVEALSNFKLFYLIAIIIITVPLMMFILNGLLYAKDIYFNTQLKYDKGKKRTKKVIVLFLRAFLIVIVPLVILNINEIVGLSIESYNGFLMHISPSESNIVLLLVPLMLAIIVFVEYRNFYLEEVCL